MIRKPKVHVLFESGINLLPFGSSYLRLIRPLSHPSIREKIEISFGFDLPLVSPDIVVIDRLWQPHNISLPIINNLIEEIKSSGAKIIYCFDDDFLGLDSTQTGYNSIHKMYVNSFLESSDALILTTHELKNLYQNYHSSIFTIPSCLDENLIIRKPYRLKRTNEKIKIGYMGTSTHDKDLEFFMPTMHRICSKYPGKIQMEFVGALKNEDILKREYLKGLPIQIIYPHPYEVQYPLFMLWFTENIHWDIGIAPLVDNQFNRCKSDIKFLDYTAAGVPGLFSALPGYQKTIENGKSGILVKNDLDLWFDMLCMMIDNPELRTNIIYEAENYLYNNRVINNIVNTWIEIFYQI